MQLNDYNINLVETDLSKYSDNTKVDWKIVSMEDSGSYYMVRADKYVELYNTNVQDNQGNSGIFDITYKDVVSLPIGKSELEEAKHGDNVLIDLSNAELKETVLMTYKYKSDFRYTYSELKKIFEKPEPYLYGDDIKVVAERI